MSYPTAQAFFAESALTACWELSSFGFGAGTRDHRRPSQCSIRFNSRCDFDKLSIIGFVLAVIAAVLLIGVAECVARKNKRPSDRSAAILHDGRPARRLRGDQMARTDRIEPDAEVVARLGRTALALPEAYEEDAWTGIRWRIRAKTFAHIMVAQAGFESSFRDMTGIADPTAILTFRATGNELLALVHAGMPFYKPPWSQTIVGMVIDDATDWAEVADLVTESYKVCAPQKLVRLLDEAPGQAPSTD